MRAPRLALLLGSLLGALPACPAPGPGPDLDARGGDAALDASLDVPQEAALDAAPPFDARPVPPGLTVTLRSDGRLDLSSDGVPLDAVEFELRLRNGSRIALSSLSPSSPAPGSLRASLPGGGLLELVAEPVAASPDARRLRWRLTGPLELAGVELRAPLFALPADARMMVDGVQSWSFAGPLTLAPGATHPRDANGNVQYPARPGSPVVDRDGTSWFRGDLLWSGGGLSFCAASPYDRWSVLDVERPEERYSLRFATGLTADDARTLTAGETLEGALVLARARSEEPFLCTRGSAPARVRGARPFPLGWWSWNTLFSQIDSPHVAAQLAPLMALEPAARHLTVDDGWERAWGDWREAPAFNGTLAGLAQQLGAGNTLGLWLAPFAVDTSAPLFAQHPEWLLHDLTTGQVLLEPLVPNHDYALLDGSHPEVQAYLTSLFADLRGRGVRLFKIDFLYAGAYPARRYNASMTGLQAWSAALGAIAAGAGDAHLNGCGSLLLPAVPFVDSMRIGADNTYVGTPPFWGSVLATGRNLAARNGLGALGVAPDPDQPVLRGLSVEEGRAFLAVTALSGGAFGYGDDLTALTDAQRATYAEPWFLRLRRHLQSPARALDAGGAPTDMLLQNPVLDSIGSYRADPQARMPEQWLGTLDDGTRVVLLFNQSRVTADRSVSAALFASTPTELVAGDAVRVSGSNLVLTVPRHAVRVLAGAAP